MAMVSNKFLASLAVRLGLHKHLQYFSNSLQGLIARYVKDLDLAYESNESVDFWLETVEDPPKVGTCTTALAFVPWIYTRS